MCLETISQGPDPAEEGEGYKVFEICRPAGTLVSPLKDFTFARNKWMSDQNDFNITEVVRYRTGFHIFSNREDAEAYSGSISVTGYRDFVVEKVKYRNVSAKGLHLRKLYGNDSGRRVPCVVAREIFIPEKIAEERKSED
jgi:hypothetical protein